MSSPFEKYIKKSSGKLEKFSDEKIKRSLRFAGLVSDETEDVTNELKQKFSSENLSTEDVYNRTKEIVFKKSHIAGYKYSLKYAIMELGPDGFVFEKFIAKILEAEGYHVEIDQQMSGRCVSHEVDIKAQKNNYTLLAECKFHNSQEIKNDLKVALYVKARMDDLKENKENIFNDFYLISNTSFSKEAIKYAECSGVKFIGFNYPIERNLYQMIEEDKHYPITCIPWLRKEDVKDLLSKNIILTHDLYANLSILKMLGYHDNEIQVFKETYEKHLSRSK